MKQGVVMGQLCRAIALPLATLLLPAVAWGQQEEGPLVFTRQEKRQWISLDNILAATEWLYRREDDTTKPAIGTETRFTEDRFEEKLQLWSHASIIHPNIVDMNLSGTFGLVQDMIKSTDQNNTQNGTVYEWDASAVILQKAEAPITVYSRRSVDMVNVEFGPSLENTLTQTGAALDWHSKVLPTRIEAYHTDQLQRALDNSQNLAVSQDTITMHSEARPTPYQALTWNYTFNDIHQTTSGTDLPVELSDSFQTQDAALTHSWDFGAKRKNNLSSSLTYYDQSGTISFKELRWDEVLRLKHTDDFETRYQYKLDQQSSNQSGVGSSDQTQQRALAGFNHHLYKSLITDGSIGLQQLDRSDGGGSKEVFGNLNFNYQKLVPLGKLSANLGLGYDQQENSSTSGITQIFNQPFSFTDPVPIIITGQRILPGSVVVTDPSGLILYTPNRDYRVRSFPDHLEIDRIVGGRIANSSPILLDYAIGPSPSNTVTTNTFSIGTRYDIDRSFLNGLAVYTRYTDQSQDIASADTAQFFPNSFKDIVYGTEYRFWNATVSAEQELYDATIVPFTATRLIGRLQQRVGMDTTATFNASYNIFDYTQEPTNHVDLFTVSAQMEHRFSRELRLNATVLWRDQSDTLTGPTKGLEEQLELRWDHRQLHVFMLFRNATLTTDALDNSYQVFQIGLRREF